MKKKIAIVGARGYSGLECCRLIAEHPEFELSVVTSSDSKWKLEDDYPRIKNKFSPIHLLTTDFIANPQGVDAILLATTAEQSYEYRPKLKTKFVVDLSGAFRLSSEEAKKYYGLKLVNDESSTACYGLCPWQTTKPQDWIANPGCYSTSVLMALLPLLKDGLIEKNHIVIDSKSGVTGAGRTPKESSHFSTLSETIFPYKVGSHQHDPEIRRYIEHFSGVQASYIFTTTLLPINRGILSSIYVTKSSQATLSQVMDSYRLAYRDYGLFEFFEHEAARELPLLSLKSITGTNKTRVLVKEHGENLIIFSMIDNLLKGAASQAVENLNRYFDLPLSVGLD